MFIQASEFLIVFFQFQTVKAMWDALIVTYDGTNEVKQARINTLNQEFELFRMKQGETIAQMQKWLSHLINHYFQCYCY